MKQEKTALEWFQMFPEPYRTQAINNTSYSGLYEQYDSPNEAVYRSFEWDKTPDREGYSYWARFREVLEDGKFQLTKPVDPLATEEKAEQLQTIVKVYGWVCPVCGAGVSPFSSSCPCVTPKHTMTC